MEVTSGAAAPIGRKTHTMLNLSFSHTTFYADRAPSVSIQTDEAGGDVTVALSLEDEARIRWQSTTTMATDAQGKAKLSSIGALITSLQPCVENPAVYLTTAKSPYGRPHFEDPAASRVLQVRVSVDGERQEAELLQQFIGPDTQSRAVADAGVCGRLYQPKQTDERVPVVVIPGSGGGVETVLSPLLSANGYTVLSLALFNYPGRPSYHDCVSLEYIAKAGQWLARLCGRDRVSVVGVSRGAEAALLTAVHFPAAFNRVAAVVPGNVITPGWNPGAGETIAPWQLNHKALPFVGSERFDIPQPPTDPTAVEPYCPRGDYVPIFESRHAQSVAGIPIESIQAPVLLVGAGDDQLWPSDIGATLLAARARHDTAQLLVCGGAGHLLAPTNTVTSLCATVFHPVMRRFFTTGGTPESQAKANRQFWTSLLSFISS